MATLAQIRDKADTKLVTIWAVILEKQLAYFAKNGRYFGLRITSASIPADDIEENATKNIDPNEPNPGDYSFTVPSTLPFQLEVHQHGTAGFTATIRVMVLGNEYVRRKSHGTIDNTHNWKLVVKDEE